MGIWRSRSWGNTHSPLTTSLHHTISRADGSVYGVCPTVFIVFTRKSVKTIQARAPQSELGSLSTKDGIGAYRKEGSPTPRCTYLRDRKLQKRPFLRLG